MKQYCYYVSLEKSRGKSRLVFSVWINESQYNDLIFPHLNIKEWAARYFKVGDIKVTRAPGADRIIHKQQAKPAML